MQTIVLLVHIVLATALVGVVLVQRSEGGGLGLGGGGGGGGTFGGLMSGRGSANLLTRSTAVLAGGFMATSLLLAILAGNYSKAPSILDLPARPASEAPAGTAPAQPATPSAPLAQ
ncbi:preprotein translocase subunit SecG [Geminicoccaceae bacterium 1502E]|uniref:Protein-export membrane protein SecG n=1 Tax=Marinimicrococcus flavescens TaxID=3031815 RepID=A0AAP3XT29_9PROT|nr:preprotein translocase subunit SecG [Marinimicrococcus flavescens]MDX6751312.1 preprotein translocase subunit SecG [Geminicoccaceae bacterium 1502E]